MTETTTATTAVLSFHNDRELYEALGTQLKAHAAADELIQGQGWEGGKGCFIGCALHEYSHEKFADVFGLPIIIGQLADSLFEAATPSEAKDFAIEVWEALRVGINYEKFTHHWHKWLICDPVDGVIRFNNDPRVAAVGELHSKALTETVSGEEWRIAAATAAAYAATAATAAYAATAATTAYAAYAAYPDAAAYADAADADADAYADAYADARSLARSKQRSKFLELLRTI